MKIDEDVMPFVIITGMHRSGTSFLARAMNLSGLYLGGLDVLISNEWNPAQDNLRGHWENKKFLELSDKTLEFNEGSWSKIPEKIILSEEIRNKLEGTLKELVKTNHLAVGIKDPRLLICLESWLAYLPKDIMIVGIFRDPLKVAESLRIRNGFDYDKSINLWKIYNQNLLSYLEKHDGFLLNFDWPKEKLLSELDIVREKLGLVKVDLSEWYTQDLIRSDKTFQSNYELPKDIEEIYSKLLNRSQKNQEVPIEIKHSLEELKLIFEEILKERQIRDNYFKKLNDINLMTNKKINEENSALKMEINTLKIEIDKIHNSIIWKLMSKLKNK